MSILNVTDRERALQAQVDALYKDLQIAEVERDLFQSSCDRLKPFADVGMQMVQITTTVRGPDEWGAIPELWTMCMNERDEACVERDALSVQIGTLMGLLDETRQQFTRDDDLPDNLLPRIDAAMEGGVK